MGPLNAALDQANLRMMSKPALGTEERFRPQEQLSATATEQTALDPHYLGEANGFSGSCASAYLRRQR